MPDKTEAEWEAEFDAQSLMRAEVIKADSARHKRALKAAKRILKEKQAEDAAMEKVAGEKAA